LMRKKGILPPKVPYMPNTPQN